MKQRCIMAFAVGLLLAVTVNRAALAVSAAEFYARGENSVILIHALCFTKDGRNIEEYGSGFILDDVGHVATARHVIPDPAKCEALSIEGAAGENALHNPRWPMTHTASHDKADVAILQIDDYAAVQERWGLVGLDVGVSEGVRPGEEIYVLGFPEGESLTIARGMITGRGGGMLRTDAPLNPGTSGGAVLLDGRGDPKAIATVKGALRYTSAGIPTEGWGYIVPIDSARQIWPAPAPAPRPRSGLADPATHIRLRERITMPNITDRSMGTDSIRYKLNVVPEGGYQIRFVDLTPAFTEIRILNYRVLSSSPDRTIMECEVSGDPAAMARFRDGDWANPNARLPIIATTTQVVRP